MIQELFENFDAEPDYPGVVMQAAWTALEELRGRGIDADDKALERSYRKYLELSPREREDNPAIVINRLARGLVDDYDLLDRQRRASPNANPKDPYQSWADLIRNEAVRTLPGDPADPPLYDPLTEDLPESLRRVGDLHDPRYTDVAPSNVPQEYRGYYNQQKSRHGPQAFPWQERVTSSWGAPAPEITLPQNDLWEASQSRPDVYAGMSPTEQAVWAAAIDPDIKHPLQGTNLSTQDLLDRAERIYRGLTPAERDSGNLKRTIEDKLAKDIQFLRDWRDHRREHKNDPLPWDQHMGYSDFAPPDAVERLPTVDDTLDPRHRSVMPPTFAASPATGAIASGDRSAESPQSGTPGAATQAAYRELQTAGVRVDMDELRRRASRKYQGLTRRQLQSADVHDRVRRELVDDMHFQRLVNYFASEPWT